MSGYYVSSNDVIIEKNLSYAQAMMLWNELDLRGFENVQVFEMNKNK